LPPVIAAPACVTNIAPSGADYSTKSNSPKSPISRSGAGLSFGLALLAAAVVVRPATRMAA
jgi:hypothetical protein